MVGKLILLFLVVMLFGSFTNRWIMIWRYRK